MNSISKIIALAAVGILVMHSSSAYALECYAGARYSTTAPSLLVIAINPITGARINTGYTVNVNNDGTADSEIAGLLTGFRRICSADQLLFGVNCTRVHYSVSLIDIDLEGTIVCP